MSGSLMARELENIPGSLSVGGWAALLYYASATLWPNAYLGMQTTSAHDCHFYCLKRYGILVFQIKAVWPLAPRPHVSWARTELGLHRKTTWWTTLHLLSSPSSSSYCLRTHSLAYGILAWKKIIHIHRLLMTTVQMTVSTVLVVLTPRLRRPPTITWTRKPNSSNLPRLIDLSLHYALCAISSYMQ